MIKKLILNWKVFKTKEKLGFYDREIQASYFLLSTLSYPTDKELIEKVQSSIRRDKELFEETKEKLTLLQGLLNYKD